MNGPLAELGFLCLFHLIGGIAIGSALRSLKRGVSGSMMFFLVWGGMFGCAPLAIGWNEFSPTGNFGFTAVELGVLGGAILLAALTPGSTLETLRSPQVSPIAMGGLFMLIGIGIGAIMWQTQTLTALGFGGCFAGAGGLVFLSSLSKLLKS